MFYPLAKALLLILNVHIKRKNICFLKIGNSKSSTQDLYNKACEVAYIWSDCPTMHSVTGKYHEKHIKFTVLTLVLGEKCFSAKGMSSFMVEMNGSFGDHCAIPACTETRSKNKHESNMLY